MRRITVELDDAALARLRDLAGRERRELRQQASWVIEQALGRESEQGGGIERERTARLTPGTVE